MGLSLWILVVCAAIVTTLPLQANCEEPCVSGTYLPDPYDCGAYYYCEKNATLTRRICVNSVFNPWNNMCDLNYECTTSPRPTTTTASSKETTRVTTETTTDAKIPTTLPSSTTTTTTPRTTSTMPTTTITTSTPTTTAWTTTTTTTAGTTTTPIPSFAYTYLIPLPNVKAISGDTYDEHTILLAASTLAWVVVREITMTGEISIKETYIMQSRTSDFESNSTTALTICGFYSRIIHIGSHQPITVLLVQNPYVQVSLSITFVYPTSSASTHYVIVVGPPSNTDSSYFRTYVTIIALNDKTSVRINFPRNRQPQIALIFISGNSMTAPNTELFHMEPLQTLLLETEGDLMGAKVVADHPVLVFAGTKQTVESSSSLNDAASFEQQLPAAYASTSYVTFPSDDVSEDVYRVTAMFDDTTVTIPELVYRDPTSGVGYLPHAADTLHLTLATDGYYVIQATKPVLVTKFSNGSGSSLTSCTTNILPESLWVRNVSWLGFSQAAEFCNLFIHFVFPTNASQYLDLDPGQNWEIARGMQKVYAGTVDTGLSAMSYSISQGYFKTYMTTSATYAAYLECEGSDVKMCTALGNTEPQTSSIDKPSFDFNVAPEILYMTPTYNTTTAVPTTTEIPTTTTTAAATTSSTTEKSASTATAATTSTTETSTAEIPTTTTLTAATSYSTTEKSASTATTKTTSTTDKTTTSKPLNYTTLKQSTSTPWSYPSSEQTTTTGTQISSDPIKSTLEESSWTWKQSTTVPQTTTTKSTTSTTAAAPTTKEPTIYESTTRKSTSTESTQKSSSAESTEKPTSTESTQKPTSTESIQKPTSTESTQKPTSTESTQKPSTESTQKPTSTESTQKPTSTESTQKPTSTESTQKPTSTESTQKPTSTESTQKPTSTESTQKPTSTESIQKPTSTGSTEKSTFSVSDSSGGVTGNSIVTEDSTEGTQKFSLDVSDFSVGNTGNPTSISEESTPGTQNFTSSTSDSSGQVTRNQVFTDESMEDMQISTSSVNLSSKETTLNPMPSDEFNDGRQNSASTASSSKETTDNPNSNYESSRSATKNDRATTENPGIFTYAPLYDVTTEIADITKTTPSIDDITSMNSDVSSLSSETDGVTTESTKTSTANPKIADIIPGNTSKLCACAKEWNMTKFEVYELVESIQGHLFVDPKTTSAHRRTLESAPDDRPSSKSIGASGLFLCLSFISVIVLSDCTRVGGYGKSKSQKN